MSSLIADYEYALPDERIAKVPLEDRASSKLLVAGPKGIQTHLFKEIPDLLPPKSLVVLNQSKVILARIPVSKKSGGAAEVFCLDPVHPSHDPAITLASKTEVIWNCLIGGKKISEGDILSTDVEDTRVQFQIQKKTGNEARVQIRWSPSGTSFGDVLEKIGKLPLPPYLKRDPVDQDQIRYQTVYAKQEGSVAAPTAGLHFTDSVFESMRAKGQSIQKVCLHVGAGTFKPVSSEDANDHAMHAERFEVEIEFLKKLHAQLTSEDPVVAVGTTSLRTLESLVWIGRQILSDAQSPYFVSQWAWKDPKLASSGSAVQSIAALITDLESKGQSRLIAETQIMIAPGYAIQVAQALVTNFHQPRSTLLLLVATFLGDARGGWKKVYEYALENGYRFLSFGDSSLLFLGCG